MGQGLIIFHETCLAEGKIYKEEFAKQSFGFHLETARGYMKLARDERIVKLTVEDMIKFKRKSLDALHDMTFLSNEEFSLFMSGRYEILKPQRKIAKSRQKPQEPSNTQNDTEQVESDSSSPDSLEMVPTTEKSVDTVAEVEKEFVNNTSLSDNHYQEIMSYDITELQKQHILLASTEYLILRNSGTRGFPFNVAS